VLEGEVQRRARPPLAPPWQGGNWCCAHGGITSVDRGCSWGPGETNSGGGLFGEGSPDTSTRSVDRLSESMSFESPMHTVIGRRLTG